MLVCGWGICGVQMGVGCPWPPVRNDIVTRVTFFLTDSSGLKSALVTVFAWALSGRVRGFHFLGSGPKGPMSCRTHGWISGRPPFRPSSIAIKGSNQHSQPWFMPPKPLSPPRHQFSLSDLKFALQTSNHLSWPQIYLQTSNLLIVYSRCRLDLEIRGCS